MCVCLCVREREREREKGKIERQEKREKKVAGSLPGMGCFAGVLMSLKKGSVAYRDLMPSLMRKMTVCSAAGMSERPRFGGVTCKKEGEAGDGLMLGLRVG